MSLISSCTFNPPSLQAWISALSVHVLLLCAGIPLGVLFYYVPDTLRKLVGLFVAIGTAASAHITISYLDNPTWIGAFLSATFGFCTFFKVIAAAFRQYPQGTDKDLATFLLWFLLLPEPVLAKGKLKQATRKEIQERAKLLVYKIAILFAFLSIMLNSHHYNLLNLPGWLSVFVSGYFHIWFIYLWASFCLDFSTLVNFPTSGFVSFEVGFRNPLLASRTLREAWGSRWDLPVHVFLKRSVYVPARKVGWGKGSAALLTFFASGLLHEYNFSIHNAVAYAPGEATIFFILMGFVMLGEDWVWRICPFPVRRFCEAMPSPVISMIWTLIAAGPFERLFLRSWIDAGMVEAIAELLPHFTCE
jgi:hypothetical protein